MFHQKEAPRSDKYKEPVCKILKALKRDCIKKPIYKMYY